MVPVPLHPGTSFPAYAGKMARGRAAFPDMLSVQSAQVNDLQISNRVAAKSGMVVDFIRPYEKLLEIAPDAEYGVHCSKHG